MSVKRTVYCSDDPTPVEDGIHVYVDVRDEPRTLLYVESLDGSPDGALVPVLWSDAVAMAKAILREES